jgi:hypothetical protein
MATKPEAGNDISAASSSGGESRIDHLFQPAVREVEARLQRLETELALLRDEVTRLRRDNEELRFERDLYQQQLLEAHRDELTPFTDEERREAEEAGLTLGQYVNELKSRPRAKP